MVQRNSIIEKAIPPTPPAELIARQHFRHIEVLGTKITLVVPSLAKDGHVLDHEHFATSVREKFQELFGGYTCSQAVGSTNLITGPQTEAVTLVTSFVADEVASQLLPAVYEL